MALENERKKNIANSPNKLTQIFKEKKKSEFHFNSDITTGLRSIRNPLKWGCHDQHLDLQL